MWVNCPKFLCPRRSCPWAAVAHVVTMCCLQLRFHWSDMGRDKHSQRTSLPVTSTCVDLGGCTDLTQSPADPVGRKAMPVGNWHWVPASLRGTAFPGLRQGLLSRFTTRVFAGSKANNSSLSLSLVAIPMPGTCLQCPGNGPAPGWVAPWKQSHLCGKPRLWFSPELLRHKASYSKSFPGQLLW